MLIVVVGIFVGLSVIIAGVAIAVLSAVGVAVDRSDVTVRFGLLD